MPSLANHQSNEFVKLLLEGDSKTGKTGSLASLVLAGYKLRILDYDNGLDILKQLILRDCPERISNVEFRTLRDLRKATALGSTIDGQPKAFSDGLKMFEKWKYDDIDYGNPSGWGSDVIFVLDSLTFFGDAAYDFREPLAIRSAKTGQLDPRAVYGDAQDAVENAIAVLTSAAFKTNVIVISHIKYVDNPDGTRKGYPSAIGSALSPLILRYFNNVVKFSNIGGKQKIETKATPMYDLANSKPFVMESQYGIETGMAKIFETLTGREGPEPWHSKSHSASTKSSTSQPVKSNAQPPSPQAPTRRL